MTVNWLMTEISEPAGKVPYRKSFIIGLEVSRENVAELAAGGRARWKIENETFNVLKTKGYTLEHNFGHGHGKRHLATVFAILNLLAFACRTVCELGGRVMGGRYQRTGDPTGLPSESPNHHRLSRVFLLGRAARETGLHPATTAWTMRRARKMPTRSSGAAPHLTSK
jgi:hypothetical protein